MLTVISSFFSIILIMGMDATQSVYFFKFKKKGKKAQAQIVSAILQWRLLWGIVIVLFGTLISPFLNVWFFKGLLSWEYFMIAFIGTLFTQVMSQSVEVMRLLYLPFSYICITLGKTILSALLILSFIIFFDKGIIGYFLGTAIASLSVAFIGWFHVREYLQFNKIYWSLWPKLIKFGLPLMPSSFVLYLMFSADRFFIQYYHGEVSLGLFAIGSKFAILIALCIETFRKAWWPIAMESMYSEDGPETFRLISILYMGIASSGIIVVTLISPTLIKWMTTSEFHSSWPLVGILAWQSVFYGFYMICSAGILKSEKTYLNFYLSAGALFVGLTLNFFLVPSYGNMGAAISTALTFFLWIIVSSIVSQLLWKINLSWFILSFQISLSAIFVIWFIYDNNETTLLFSSLIALIIVIIILTTSIQFKKKSFYLRTFNRKK